VSGVCFKRQCQINSWRRWRMPIHLVRCSAARRRPGAPVATITPAHRWQMEQFYLQSPPLSAGVLQNQLSRLRYCPLAAAGVNTSELPHWPAMKAIRLQAPQTRSAERRKTGVRKCDQGKRCRQQRLLRVSLLRTTKVLRTLGLHVEDS